MAEIAVDATDRRGRTSLHYAAQLGRELSGPLPSRPSPPRLTFYAVKHLLAAGASPNAKDSAGDTPLHYACHAAASAVVHALIGAKADVNSQNNKTFTPMHIAVELENDTICHILTQSGADIGIRYDTRFYQLRHQKHVHQLRATVLPDDEDGPRPKSVAKKRGTAEEDSEGDVPAPSTSSDSAANPELDYLRLKVDRYGYIVSGSSMRVDPDVDTAPPGPKEAKLQKKLQIERTKKWLKMLRKWHTYTKKKSAKIARRVWKGIPDPVRGQAWRCIMGTAVKKAQSPTFYADLLKKSGVPKVVHQIDLDINRSARDHIQFHERFGPGQISLFNILRAYSIHDPVVEYCQSMSDVTAFVLMQIEEEEAFWFLCDFLQSPKFRMNRRYENGFFGLYESFHVHTELLKRFYPVLAKQFEDDGVIPALYTMNWFMKVFIDCLPSELVLRMWDLMLLVGFDIVYSYIVVIIGYYQSELVGKAFSEAVMFLQRIRDLPSHISVDQFFSDVKALNIKPSLLREFENSFQAAGTGSSSTTDAKVTKVSDADRATRRQEILSEKAPERAKRDEAEYSQDDVDASAQSESGLGATFNPLGMELPPPVSDDKSKRRSRVPEELTASTAPDEDRKEKRQSALPADDDQKEKRKSTTPADDDPKEKRKSKVLVANGSDSQLAKRKSEKRKSRVPETSS